jgi:iron complex transport system substrate-binding protein
MGAAQVAAVLFFNMKHSLLAIIVLAVVTGCGQFGSKHKDGGPARIVSVSKQLTEIVFALGEGKKLVACDITSGFPDSAKLLPTVGNQHELNAALIISLHPNAMIFCNDIGPNTIIPQLQQAGINLKAFGGANSYDSAQSLIRELGYYLHVQQKADSIISMMERGLIQIYQQRNAYTDVPRVMVIDYSQPDSVFFVLSGQKGPADRMIEMASGKPAAYNAKETWLFSAQAVAAANPDAIIVTNFGFDKIGGAAKIKNLPGVALTNAAKYNRIYRFEERDLLYFGPRSSDNILKLMQLIHQSPHGFK